MCQRATDAAGAQLKEAEAEAGDGGGRDQEQRRRWRDEERGRDDEGRGECEPKGSKGDARARVSQRATDAAEAGDSAGEAMGEGAITRAEASASPRAATETRE